MTGSPLPEVLRARVWGERVWPRLVAERAAGESALPQDEGCRVLLLPYAGALAWLELLARDEGQEGRVALARRALSREGHPTPSPDFVAPLATALPGGLQAIAEEVGLAALPLSWLLVPREEEGGFFLDTRVARHFEQQGALDLAGMVRKKSQAVWEQYQAAMASPFATPSAQERLHGSLWWLFANEDLEKEGLPPLAVAVLLGRLLLRAGKTNPTPERAAQNEEHLAPSAPRQEEEARPVETKTPPTGTTAAQETSATVHLEIARTYVSLYKPGGVSLSQDQKQLLRGGEVIADVASLPRRDMLLLQQGLKHFGNLTFRRAVNYLVRACWARHLANEAVPHILEFNGPKDFAECIGEPVYDNSTDILHALRQGQHFSISWPGGEIGGLWLYHYQRACRGRPSWLELQLARILRPHYGMAELDSPWRVPLVPFAPFVGRHNHHAAQAAFQDLFLLTLVERHREILTYGGVRIDEERRRRMAREVGLPNAQLSPLMARWTRSGPGGDAFLEQPETDLFLLADTPPYRGGRRFLLEAARRSQESKAAAQRGLKEKQRRHLTHTPLQLPAKKKP